MYIINIMDYLLFQKSSILSQENGADILMKCFERNRRLIESFFSTPMYSLITGLVNTGAAKAAIAAGSIPDLEIITVGDILNLTNWA